MKDPEPSEFVEGFRRRSAMICGRNSAVGCKKGAKGSIPTPVVELLTNCVRRLRCIGALEFRGLDNREARFSTITIGVSNSGVAQSLRGRPTCYRHHSTL